MKITKVLLTLATGLALGLGTSRAASAAVVTPSFNTFGTLAAATFGGSDIPNDAVAITTLTFTNGDIVTLGLTATQRHENPAVTSDGAGTFFAQAGGDVLDGQPGLAVWNFDYYAHVAGTGTYSFILEVDNNAGVGTDEGSLLPFPFFLSGGGTLQDSQNIGFAFIGGNPALAGQYSFVLKVVSATSAAEIGRSAINVNVAAAPEPATMTLLGLGGLAMIGRVVRKRRA